MADPPHAAVYSIARSYQENARARSIGSGSSSRLAEYATSPVNVEWSVTPAAEHAVLSSAAWSRSSSSEAVKSTRSKLCCTTSSPSSRAIRGAHSSADGQRLTAKQLLMPRTKLITRILPLVAAASRTAGDWRTVLNHSRRTRKHLDPACHGIEPNRPRDEPGDRVAVRAPRARSRPRPTARRRPLPCRPQGGRPAHRGASALIAPSTGSRVTPPATRSSSNGAPAAVRQLDHRCDRERDALKHRVRELVAAVAVRDADEPATQRHVVALAVAEVGEKQRRGGARVGNAGRRAASTWTRAAAVSSAA